MRSGSVDARIRSLRPPKEQVDPLRALDFQWESERIPGGEVVPMLTIFLAGSECPFTCAFCDLWRYTLDEPTPAGAIPYQIEQVLAQVGELPDGSRVKLYNASNFFDHRAVPPADLPRIARLVEPFERVVVECHPRLVGDDCRRFADEIGGALEVAMGLETVHPEALRQLNKRMSKEDYDRAAGVLASNGIPHRAFVLLGAPGVPPDGLVDWAVISTGYALAHGAETVAIIPVRGGNGELDRLAGEGAWRPPTLTEAEMVLERSLRLPGSAPERAVVLLDLWEIEKFSACSACFEDRRERLERVNLSGGSAARIECGECGGAS